MITSRQVLDEGAVIVLMARLYRSAPQAVCNSLKTDDDARVTHLHCVVDLDPSTQSLREMEPGDVAFRSPGGEWRYQRFWSDTDFDIMMADLPNRSD